MTLPQAGRKAGTELKARTGKLSGAGLERAVRACIYSSLPEEASQFAYQFVATRLLRGDGPVPMNTVFMAPGDPLLRSHDRKYGHAKRVLEQQRHGTKK